LKTAQTATINSESLAHRVGLGLLLFLVLRVGVVAYDYAQSAASLSNPLLPQQLKDVVLGRYEVKTTLLVLGILFCGGFLYIRKPKYAVVSAAVSVVLVPVFDYSWDLLLR